MVIAFASLFDYNEDTTIFKQGFLLLFGETLI